LRDVDSIIFIHYRRWFCGRNRDITKDGMIEFVVKKIYELDKEAKSTQTPVPQHQIYSEKSANQQLQNAEIKMNLIFKDEKDLEFVKEAILAFSSGKDFNFIDANADPQAPLSNSTYVFIHHVGRTNEILSRYLDKLVSTYGTISLSRINFKVKI